MKNPCPLCGKQKTQRRCIRQNNAAICSLCCAGLRDETCGDCSYQTAARRYQATRSAPAPAPTEHFTIMLNPEVESAVDSALEFCENGKIDAAWTAMTRLLREHPRDHNVCYGMGVLHAVKCEYNEAIKWFDKATSIFPYFVEAHYNKAVAYQKQLYIGKAVRAYRKVLEIGDPNDTPAKEAQSFLDFLAATIFKSEGIDLDCYLESEQEFDRAYVLMEQGDWAGALSGFRASAALNDRSAPTHGNMGLCLAKLGRKAQSLAELDRALEIDPGYTPAKTNRVTIKLMKEGIPFNIAGFKQVEFGKEQLLGTSEGGRQ